MLTDERQGKLIAQGGIGDRGTDVMVMGLERLIYKDDITVSRSVLPPDFH